MPHIGQLGDGLSLSGTQQAKPPDQLGQEEFIRLLLAQIKNQDPLEPLSSIEFTTQLAQFASLEQLTSANTKLDGLKALQESIRETQALGHLDKEVVVWVVDTRVAEGNPEALEYELDFPATSVTISVLDGLGGVLWTKTEQNVSVGTYPIGWDGKDLKGQVVGDGSYLVRVTATNGSGESLTVPTLLRGVVEAITHNLLGEPLLKVGNRAVPLEAVLQVADAPAG